MQKYYAEHQLKITSKAHNMFVTQENEIFA